MVLERIYTISLSKIYSIGRHRERARKAIKYIKAFTVRHMKTSEEDIILGQDLNEHVWMNGIQKPPRKIKVKMVKDDTGKVKLTWEAPEKVKVEKKEKKKVKKEIKKSKPKQEKKVKKEVKKKAPAKKKEKVE